MSVRIKNKKKSGGRSVQPVVQVQPAHVLQSGRSAKLLLLALLGTAAIVVAVVLATPLEDIDPSLEETQFESTSSATLSDQGSPASAEEPKRQRRVTRFEDLDLPTVAEAVDVSALKVELRDLAEWLRLTYPSDPGALHLAAQTYAELNQTQRAMEIWQKSIDLNSQAPGPYIGLAQLKTEAGDEAGAIALLTEASERGIASSELSLQLGVAYENLGELEKSETCLLQATKAFSGNADLWMALGRVQQQLSKFAEAEQSIRRSIEVAGESEPALYALSIALTRQRKVEQAAKVREQLAQLRSTSEKGSVEFQSLYANSLAAIAKEQFLAVAALAEETGDLERSEALVRRSLALIPDDLQCYMQLSSIYRRRGQYDAAFEIQKQLVTLQPENLLNYLNFASVALQLGQSPVAEQTLQKAITLDPDGVLAQASLARLYLASGRASEAKSLAEHVLDKNQSVESHVLLATVYEAMGEFAKAQQVIAQAKAMDPNHPLFDGN